MVDIKNTSSPVHILPPNAQQNAPKAGAPVGVPAGNKPGVKPAVTGKAPVKKVGKSANYSAAPFWAGASLSVAWVALVTVIVLQSGATHSFAGLPLAGLAVAVTAITAPIGLIWMVCAYMQRAADVQSVVEPLRRQLMLITGESGLAEQRIRRFNQVVREQLELLRDTRDVSHDDLMQIVERVRDHKLELDQFEKNSVLQVQEIQEVVRRSMQHIEQVMEDKFTMMRILDGKLNQSGEQVAAQTAALREQLSGMLQEIEANGNLIAVSLERATNDSKKLADTARAQETSITSAAETAASTLGELSGKIDVNIARFLERASSAREEAERLAGALDAQTRSLDEFTAVLPSRVGEAETVLHGVADRLYASEQLAREQAVALSDKLSSQVDNLQGMLSKMTSSFTEIDGSMQSRRNDMDALIGRISAASDNLGEQLKSSVDKLGVRAEASLDVFKAANDEAQRGVDGVSKNLAEMAAKFDIATKQLGQISTGSSEKMKSMADEASSLVKQFETLQSAAKATGEDVSVKASGAVQDLQGVLDRLLSARDAAQGVGEALTEKMRKAVDENEILIVRINEAAQMSVRALSVATETLGRQETELSGKSKEAEASLQEAVAKIQEQAVAAEKAMQTNSENITSLLDEMAGKMGHTEKSLADFASRAVDPVTSVLAQIEDATDTGLKSIGRYEGAMQDKLGALQDFNEQVSSMGAGVASSTSEALEIIQKIGERFTNLRTSQDETVQKTIEQFKTVAEKVQSEVGSLDQQGINAVRSLQEAAARVSEQAQALQRDAQESGTKIGLVTAALQKEASVTREALSKQAEDLNATLSVAEQKFGALGGTLKERTDEAYALMDRVSAHYDEITKATTQDFIEKATKIEDTSKITNEKVEALNDALRQQLGLIGAGATQIDTNAGQITAATGKAVQQIGIVADKLAKAGEATTGAAQTAVARLDETNVAMMRQYASVNDAAQGAVLAIQKAGTSFGDQADKMMEATAQTEQKIRGLGVATTALSDQAAQVRGSIEQQSQKLVTSLTEAVASMNATSEKLQQSVATATLGTDQAAKRFDEMTSGATVALTKTNDSLMAMADKTGATLASLGSSMTQQIGALNMISEQIVQQRTDMDGAAESQKASYADLFDKLAKAHEKASSIAGDTIIRLSGSLEQITKQLATMDDKSEKTVANVRAAGSSFGDQSAQLLQQAQEAERQVRSVLSVTGALSEQAKQLREGMNSDGEKTNALLSALLSKLTAGSEDLRDLGANAEKTLTGLQTNINAQTASFADSIQQISDRQKALTSALDTQRDVLNSLLARLTTAQDEAASSSERNVARLTESAQSISKELDAIDTKSQSVWTNLKSVSAGIADAAQNLKTNADAAEVQAKNVMISTTALAEQTKNLHENIRTDGEKTGEALTSLVTKLANGGSDLRDIGSATSANLSNLQQQVTEQAATLNALMQQIGERQRVVTSALDSQKDSLNGVLTRLTAAQDETANSAERNVSRLTESASQVEKQMEAMDKQAQSTLSNVRSVGSDLADQTGSLQLQAQQAEQQMRNMLTIASGLQDQAKDIRKTMTEEATGVIDSLGNVTTRLETSTKSLKEQGGSMVASVNEAVLQLGDVVKTGCEALKGNTEDLKTMAGDARGVLESEASKVREQTKLLGEASDEANTKALALSKTTEDATGRLTTLQATLGSGDEQARDLLAKSIERMDDVKSKLYDELQHIADVSDTAVRLLQAAGTNVMTNSDALRANLASSESALKQAADLVREEGQQVPAVLSRGTEDIENARKALKAQADEASDTLVKTADRFIGVNSAVRDTMIDEMKDLESVTTTAEQTLTSFTEALTKQLVEMQHGSGMLATEQQTLVAAANQTLTQLVNANQKLHELHQDAAVTAEQVSKAFANVESHAGSANEKLTQVSTDVAHQIDLLAQTTSRAESQMLGASQSFREQLERIRSGVQSQIDDINRGLMQITAQLERTGTTLRAATSGTVSDLEKIGTQFDHTSREASAMLTDRTTRMRSATEEVAKLLNGFGDQLDMLLDRMSVAGDDIKRHESDVNGQLQTALTQLGSVAERLEANRLLTATVSDQAVSRLAEVADVVEQQMTKMNNDSETVADMVRGVGRIYAEQNDGLNRGVTDAQNQVMAMEQTIDGLQQRTDRMRVSLKMQGEELVGGLEQILQQLSMAGNIMGDTLDDLAARHRYAGDSESEKKVV